MSKHSSEVQFLYGAVFNNSCPKALEDLYVRYDAIMAPYRKLRYRVRLDIIMEQDLDVISIEYALRMSRKDNCLTQKIGIILYLGELMPENVDRFSTYVSSPIRGWFDMINCIPSVIIRLIVGKYLIYRHGLVAHV